MTTLSRGGAPLITALPSSPHFIPASVGIPPSPILSRETCLGQIGSREVSTEQMFGGLDRALPKVSSVPPDFF